MTVSFVERIKERRGFVGRDVIFAAIDEQFFPMTESGAVDALTNNQCLPCYCISGLVGMGKTQTAIQYAIGRRERFDAVFVIKADNSAKLLETFYKIAPALGLMDGGDKGEKHNEDADLIVYRNRSMEWLSSRRFSALASSQRSKILDNSTNQRLSWLLIFDNVEDTSILRDYWPVGNIGCVLVTNRDARNSKYLQPQSQVKHIYLNKLDTTFASELLLQLSCVESNDSNNKIASAIVEKLGILPLAIEQVAAYMHGKGMTVKEFLTLYDKTLLERRKSDTSSGSCCTCGL